MGALGAAMLAASLLLISGATTFPGPATLLPVVGTLLLLLAGTHPYGAVRRALSQTPMVKIGDSVVLDLPVALAADRVRHVAVAAHPVGGPGCGCSFFPSRHGLLPLGGDSPAHEAHPDTP